MYRHLEDSRAVGSLLNLRTGERVRAGKVEMRDFGDLHVYPTDMERQVRVTAAEIHRLALDHERIVILGGEHSISFPAYLGVAEAAQARGDGSVGYLQIDHHFDFGDHAVLYGPVYHGSNARRISEVRTCGPGGQAFVGPGDLTSLAQYTALASEGYVIRTMQDVRRDGFGTSLAEALTAVLEHSDRLYVSVDVDVCDAAALPGTGNVTIGGISAAELLEVGGALRALGSTLASLDVVEISPRFDSAGITASVVARLLFETLVMEDA
jgi:arginase family enzyme